MSVASAGCLLWLQRLQPLLAAIAVSALSYQAWLVWRRPTLQRTPTMLRILWGSLGISSFVALVWLWSWLRYR